MKSKLAKELLILALLLVVILFVLFVLLYDFVPGKKESIKSVEYVAENTVSEVLDEIKENTGVDVQKKDSETPLKSYSVESEDLNVYASENSYESGKSNPFDEEAKPAEEIHRTVTNQNTSSSKKEEPKQEVKQEKKETTTVNTSVANTTETTSTNISKADNTKSNTVKKEETKNETKKETSTGSFFESVDRK